MRSEATKGSRPSTNNSFAVPDDPVNGSANLEETVDSDVELPATDEGSESGEEVEASDDELPPELDRTRTNHFIDDEAETDDEDQRRRTRYEAESDEDEKPAEQEDLFTMPKATRKSINPLESAHSDESESEEELISDSEDEDEKNKKNLNNVKKRDESLVNETFDESIAAKFSSTMMGQKEAEIKEVVDLSDDSVVEVSSC